MISVVRHFLFWPFGPSLNEMNSEKKNVLLKSFESKKKTTKALLNASEPVIMKRNKTLPVKRHKITNALCCSCIMLSANTNCSR